MARVAHDGLLREGTDLLWSVDPTETRCLRAVVRPLAALVPALVGCASLNPWRDQGLCRSRGVARLIHAGGTDTKGGIDHASLRRRRNRSCRPAARPGAGR